MKRYLHAILPALTTAALASADPAQRAVVLHNLSVQPITRLLTLSDHVFEVEYPDGSIRRLSTDRLVALTQTFERTISPLTDVGWIELIDGQRIVGRMAELASDSEAVAWMHRDFGVLWIPLESVASIAPFGAPEEGFVFTADDLLGDSVHLKNEDVVSGYLLHAGNEVRVEHFDGAKSTTPIDRVTFIHLANESESPEGTYIWLVDGSVFSVRSIDDLTGERVQVELQTGERAVLRVAQIHGVVMRTENIHPLSMIPSESNAPSERRWTNGFSTYPVAGSREAPLLFASDLHIPGVTTLRWELQPGAAFFGTRIVMPAEAFPWGDCDVIVRSGSTEVFRARLNEEAPHHDISVALSSTVLEIEIIPGEFGPINDLVRLYAPLVRYAND